MFDALDSAREAIEAYYAARDAVSKANLYQTLSLGRVDALRALQAHERAFADARDALQALPHVGEAIERYNRVTGYELCDDTAGHLERLLVTGQVGQILDDLYLGGAASTAVDAEICL